MRTEFLCIYILRVASGPRVKLVSCKSAVNPPVVKLTILRAAGCRLRAAGCGLRAAGCGLRAAGCGLRTYMTAAL